MVRCPSYLVLSKTFLLGVGLTDLSEFGRYLGQNKAIVSDFHGPVIYFNPFAATFFWVVSGKHRWWYYVSKFFRELFHVVPSSSLDRACQCLSKSGFEKK